MSKPTTEAALTASPRSFDPATPLHDGWERPFKPRALGHSEFKHRNVFRFLSPKEDRIVDVCGPLELAFRLMLEFDSAVCAVTERPRKLDVGKSTVELSCWWRDRSGRERFALLIPDANTVPGTDGKRRPRQIERLRAAAHDAGFVLELITEDAVRDKAARIELYHQLLGFVQSARLLKSGLVLRHEVLAVIGLYPRVRIEQLTHELGRFTEAHVHIVVAELLFLGAIETDAVTRLRQSSLVWRATA